MYMTYDVLWGCMEMEMKFYEIYEWNAMWVECQIEAFMDEMLVICIFDTLTYWGVCVIGIWIFELDILI